MGAQEREQRSGVEAPRMDPADAGAADWMVLIRVGLLIELSTLAGGERTPIADEHFAGSSRTAIDRDGRADRPQRALHRHRTDDQRDTDQDTQNRSTREAAGDTSLHPLNLSWA